MGSALRTAPLVLEEAYKSQFCAREKNVSEGLEKKINRMTQGVVEHITGLEKIRKFRIK